MTDAATKARNAAQHCEAKKHALRQTQDGIVVAFVLHPNDVPPALQLAPLGTRYMLAFVEIDEDEQPKEVMSNKSEPIHTGPHVTPPASDSSRVPARAKSPVTKLYAQQAGRICNEPKFWAFLREAHMNASEIHDDVTAAEWVRTYCDVQSRSEILPGTVAGTRWELLLSSYRVWDLAPSVGAA